MIKKRLDTIKTGYPSQSWLKKKHQNQLNKNSVIQFEDNHNPFEIEDKSKKKPNNQKIKK